MYLDADSRTPEVVRIGRKYRITAPEKSQTNIMCVDFSIERLSGFNWS